MQPPEPRRDCWLSDVLGIDAWTESAPPGVAPALVTRRVPTEDVDALRAAEAHGFALVDVNVTLERSGDDVRTAASAEVAPATDEQAAALLDIAGSCFRYSRFHLDPLIPREAADRVKREWVRSYVEGRRGIELLAASADDRVAGFLAVLEAADGARVIDLVGVDAAVQGAGVGEALVSAFVRRHGAGGALLRVGTQVANVPSLRLYEKLGFRIVSATYVLHRHLA